MNPEAQQSAQEPWHMWGTSSRVVIQAGSGTTSSSQQLSRITYKRPETWSFFLGAKIIGGDLSSGGGGILIVRFDLQFGVGRSVFLSQQSENQGPGRVAFAKFQWDFAGSPHLATPQDVDFANKYTTRVQTPPMIDEDLETAEQIEWIPAQNIQCHANITYVRTDPGQSIAVEVLSFFAPRTHVRPDWSLTHHPGQFSGETGGS